MRGILGIENIKLIIVPIIRPIAAPMTVIKTFFQVISLNLN